jgi:hypothetical protein
MCPYQYRHSAAVLDELERDIKLNKDGGLHHSYEK